MRVGWKVHRLTTMQWLNLTKCGLFFNIVSHEVHTLLPSVLQRLDSSDIEALILILEKVLNCNEMSLVLLFKVLNYLSSGGFLWKETMQLASGKVEFNACQVSLLWHKSLVSLWTFQPTVIIAKMYTSTHRNKQQQIWQHHVT